MSWYGGTHMTARDDGVKPSETRRSSRLASNAPWVTMTPRGWEVEPEVYWRTARSAGRSVAGGSSGDPDRAVTSSMARTATSGLVAAETSDAMPDVVNTAVAPLLRTSVPRRSAT